MMERTRTLGDVHEERVLAACKDQFGDGVVEIAHPGTHTSRADAMTGLS